MSGDARPLTALHTVGRREPTGGGCDACRDMSPGPMAVPGTREVVPGDSATWSTSPFATPSRTRVPGGILSTYSLEPSPSCVHRPRRVERNPDKPRSWRDSRRDRNTARGGRLPRIGRTLAECTSGAKPAASGKAERGTRFTETIVGHSAVTARAHPIILGCFRFPTKDKAVLEVRSFERAIEAAKFFGPMFGSKVVLRRLRIINRLIRASEADGGLERLDKLLDANVVKIDPAKLEAEIEALLALAPTQEEKQRDYFAFSASERRRTFRSLRTSPSRRRKRPRSSRISP